MHHVTYHGGSRHGMIHEYTEEELQPVLTVQSAHQMETWETPAGITGVIHIERYRLVVAKSFRTPR